MSRTRYLYLWFLCDDKKKIKLLQLLILHSWRIIHSGRMQRKYYFPGKINRLSCKRKILSAYRVLDHFRHIFREVGLTLTSIVKSRIGQVCRQYVFHGARFPYYSMWTFVIGFVKISAMISFRDDHDYSFNWSLNVRNTGEFVNNTRSSLLTSRW